MLLAALKITPDEGTWPPAQFEGPLWRLVNERPQHLLAARYTDWAAFLRQAIDDSSADLEARCGQLSRCTWGSRNLVRIRHPLSGALPGLASLLDMPGVELAGDHDLPRVQDEAFGASERFAVAPGHEADGYLLIPGGQSGHPLSPYYRAGFAEWARGQPLPFLPGPAQHTLSLTPR
jgi:penicillin amidase